MPLGLVRAYSKRHHGAITMRVALYVTDEPASFVAAFTIPPFSPSPDVLMWGSRVFNASRNGVAPITDKEGRAIYVESFAYFIVQEQDS